MRFVLVRFFDMPMFSSQTILFNEKPKHGLQTLQIWIYGRTLYIHYIYIYYIDILMIYYIYIHYNGLLHYEICDLCFAKTAWNLWNQQKSQADRARRSLAAQMPPPTEKQHLLSWSCFAKLIVFFTVTGKNNHVQK